MNKSAIAILLLVVASVRSASGCDQKTNDDSTPTMVQVRENLVRHNNQFALELHRRLAAHDTDKSLISSPASISNVAGMLYLGAKGDTSREMAATLHFRAPANELGRLLSLAAPNRKRSLYRLGLTVVENKQDGVVIREVAPNSAAAASGLQSGDRLLSIDEVSLRSEADFLRAVDYSTGRIVVRRFNTSTEEEEDLLIAMEPVDEQSSSQMDRNSEYLQMANAIWVQEGYDIRQEYTDLLAETFRAKTELADFANATDESISRINHWVSEQTRNAIPEIVTSDTVDSMTRLVVTNAVAFEGLWTQAFDPRQTQEGVFLGLDQKEYAVPMMRASRQLKIFETSELTAIELPYRDSTLNMVILMPNEGFALPDLERRLSSDELERFIRELKSTLVDLQLPRFAVSSNAPVKDVLVEMGMKAAFDPARADFSGINSSRDLYLSAIVHRAKIEVDEKGTKAAAATAGVAVPRGGFSVPLRVNRPFLFLVRDSMTEGIIFIGRFTRP